MNSLFKAVLIAELANHLRILYSMYIEMVHIFRHCFIGVGTYSQPEIVSLLSLSIVLVSHGL